MSACRGSVPKVFCISGSTPIQSRPFSWWRRTEEGSSGNVLAGTLSTAAYILLANSSPTPALMVGWGSELGLQRGNCGHVGCDLPTGKDRE